MKKKLVRLFSCLVVLAFSLLHSPFLSEGFGRLRSGFITLSRALGRALDSLGVAFGSGLEVHSVHKSER